MAEETKAIILQLRPKFLELRDNRIYEEREVAKAARIAGCEGYAIVKDNQIKSMKWFVN